MSAASARVEELSRGQVHKIGHQVMTEPKTSEPLGHDLQLLAMKYKWVPVRGKEPAIPQKMPDRQSTFKSQCKAKGSH